MINRLVCDLSHYSLDSLHTEILKFTVKFLTNVFGLFEMFFFLSASFSVMYFLEEDIAHEFLIF